MRTSAFAAISLGTLIGLGHLTPAGGQAHAAGGAANAETDGAKNFVQAAAMSDLFETQSSRLALTKTDDDDIRSFAQRMISGHNDSSTKLKSIVKDQKIDATMPETLDQEHQDKMKRLQGLSGLEFDREYARIQQDTHMKALKLMRTYSESGENAALKQFAADTSTVVQGHFRQAQNLP